MAKVTMTPFEKAVCAWILKLPGTWTRVDWSQVTQTQDAAIDRLVKGGFVEARLAVALHVKGEAGPINTMWRVSGDYSSALSSKVLYHLVAHGYEGRETQIRCGEFEEVRLTADGELARQELSKSQADHLIFSGIAGGPDGTRGITAAGMAHLESWGSTTSEVSNQGEPAPTAPDGLLRGGSSMDPKEVDDFVNWVKADQEEAEFANGRTNPVQAEAMAFLRSLSRNWQPGVEMGVDSRERQLAAIILIWSGYVETRFDLNIYSEAPTVRAEVFARGPWEQLLVKEGQGHFGRFLRGQRTWQKDTKRQLRLTVEGERCQFDIQKHPENDGIVWSFVSTNQVAPQLGFRLLEEPGPASGAAAVAGAQAIASVGNVVVNNTIDLGSLAGLLAQSAGNGKAGEPTAAPAGGTDGKPRNASDAGDEPTPETDATLIYQAEGSNFYNIPKSTLSKAAAKTPGTLGYLWSGHKGDREFYRKADLEKLAKSRQKLRGT